MRKILVSLLLLLPVMLAAKTDRPTTLVVWMQDGSQTTFLLSKTPRVRVGDSLVTVETTDGNTIELPREEVTRYTLGGSAPTAIRQPEVATAPGRPLFKGDRVLFSGLKAGTRIVIMSLDGKVVNSRRAAADGTSQVSLSGIPAGVYVVKAGTSAIKVAVR